MMDTNVRLVSDSPPRGNDQLIRLAYRGPLGWWYRLTAPAQPPETASLTVRELARRGRLTSATLLVVILLVLAAYPIAFLTPNHVLAIVLLIPILIDTVALFFNRAGKIAIAGVLVVVGIEVGIGLSILGPALSGGGLTTYILPQFDLLVQADFVAVSLLRPRSVIWLAGLHIVLSVLAITFLPRTPEFAQMLSVNGYEVYLRLITLQIIVAFVTFLWVTGAQQAIQRADRAEEIAALEQREIEQQQLQIEQKQQLDTGIQFILQTHVQVANGNFAARAPLGKENMLWQIAYSLNNLLARLQSYSQMLSQYQHMQEENYRLHNALQSNTTAQHELQRTRVAATRLIELLKQSQDGRIPTSTVRSGTVIDAVVTQLSNSTSSLPTSEQRPIIPQRTREQGIPKNTRPMNN
ncbi:MAG TPA: hypothetical protein DDW33_13635 [Ktedonobacter sp.]|jgi:uncharacterized membrane protein|nr:hypothetical protein [Ktedonobacter sp.]HBE26718.1 hypothetical protein [Ktedonobacter sp.]